jgi:hypothetical protein
MVFGKEILEAELQEEGTSEIRNPLLKIALIIIPFAVVFHEVLNRYGYGVGITPTQTVVVLYGIFLAAISNTSEGNARNFLRSAIIFGLFAISVAALTSDRYEWLDAIAKTLSSAYQKTPILSVINLRTWLIIFAIIIAIRAARNIQSRDALWLGRRLLSGWTFRTYIIFAVTYSVVQSVLFNKLEEAWTVATSRYHLAANPDSTCRDVRPRLQKMFWWFLSVLGRGSEYVGDLIFSLVHERGFFREQYKDAHASHFGRGDVVATALLTSVAVVVVVIGVSGRPGVGVTGPPTTPTPVITK